jgi:CTP:molybdopterin cytidylyltransferase MocA
LVEIGHSFIFAQELKSGAVFAGRKPLFPVETKYPMKLGWAMVKRAGNSKMPVAAIVLGAGASSRLGQPKQLLMMGEETMIGRAIRMANAAGAAPVIAVLGAYCEKIRATIPKHLALTTVNSSWKEGIATSIHAGLDALDRNAPQTRGVLILGCDQPRLTADHLRALLEAFGAHAAPTVVASAYAGTVGIPAVFPREVFAALRALRGDKGARSLLMKPTCPLVTVDFPGGEIDIDLPADLAQLESLGPQ